MFDPKALDELSKTLYNALPSSLKNIEQDIQQKFRDILQSTFNKLDLVTREEFDTQVKVLQRTREKVDQLEKTLLQYQKDMADKKADDKKT